MANTYQDAKLNALAGFLSPDTTANLEAMQEAFEQNRHHIYSLSFWMTDNELSAEELMAATFRRAFSATDAPSADAIDAALISELREEIPVGPMTLDCAVCSEVKNVRENTLRVHLERAVVQLPATERMIFLLHDVEGYNHARIAKLIGLTENESQNGLHQARLRMRELLATMK
jgi:DNA-directed RNA polymerase specialized sigma24 family protein